MEISKYFSMCETPSTLLSPQQLRQCETILHCADELAFCQISLTNIEQELSSHGENCLAEYYLAADEREKFLSFQFVKRKVEWLGGRIAAKQAAGQLLAPASAQPDWQNFRVHPDQDGRPYLTACRPVAVALPDISISHSAALAAALASRNRPCGLDIQKITPTPEKVKERFATSQEISLLLANPFLQESGRDASLTLLWSAKEAFRKLCSCRPVIGFSEVQLTEITGAHEHGFACRFSCSRPALPPALICYATLHTDFACALAVMPESIFTES